MEDSDKNSVVVNTFLVLFVPLFMLGLKIAPKLANWAISKQKIVSSNETEYAAEAVRIQEEMKKISMVDEFAKYAKLQRRLNLITMDLESTAQARQLLQVKVQTYATVAIYVVSILLYLVLLWCTGIATPVFVLPKQWFGPLSMLLAYPTGMEGAISIPVWTVTMRNVISLIVK